MVGTTCREMLHQPAEQDQSELRMTTAYLVMAHRDALMFRRLVAALPETASVYAHIDARVDVKPFEVGCPSVIFLEHRLSPNWASWTIVEVATLLLEAALRDTSVARCTLLSGRCFYPILSPNALTAWEEDPLRAINRWCPAPNPKWGKEAWRFERRWNTTGRRKPDSLTRAGLWCAHAPLWVTE